MLIIGITEGSENFPIYAEIRMTLVGALDRAWQAERDAAESVRWQRHNKPKLAKRWLTGKQYRVLSWAADKAR